MNGSSACDASTAPAAAFPTSTAEGSIPLEELLPISGESESSDTGDPSISFDDLLGSESTEAPAEDPDEPEKLEPSETTCWLTDLPVGAPPPQVLLAQSTTIPKEESSARVLAEAPILPANLPPPAVPENILPAPAQAPESGTEQIAAKLRIQPSKPGGMPVAQEGSMVFTNSMHEENAAADQQQAKALGVEYQESPEFEKELALHPAAGSSRDSKTAEASDSSSALHPIEATTGSARLDREFARFETDFAPASDAKRVASRTLEAIGGHVQLLRSTGQDRLEVVLKPDAATAIHLAVVRMDGQIQVQARCERGHFAALDAQWGAMQSALAAQGIRLEPLQAGSNLSYSTGQHFGGQQGQQQASRDEAETFRSFSFEQDMPHPAPAGPGQPESWLRRGWQRWA